MKKQLSDEQLDNLMRSVLNDASANDETIIEIADSPAVWWGVQRQISAQKDEAQSAPTVWRWLMIGVPVAAAVVLAVSFFVMRPSDSAGDQANNVSSVAVKNIHTTINSVVKEPLYASTSDTKADKRPAKRDPTAAKFVTAKQTNQRPTTAAIKTKAAEIKTDFIALSYARNPESGQIVRVKVPSSMMVTLGLVATVEKPSSLVDAEVIVGDDGLTRAIRFIR